MRSRPDSADPRRFTEQRLFPTTAGGALSVCLAYPNTYPVAMANLGYQAVYRIFAQDPRIQCDRAYLPERPAAHLRSFEGERPLGDFDVLAFSISFETDYANVLSMLAAAGLPLRRAER